MLPYSSSRLLFLIAVLHQGPRGNILRFFLVRLYCYLGFSARTRTISSGVQITCNFSELEKELNHFCSEFVYDRLMMYPFVLRNVYKIMWNQLRSWVNFLMFHCIYLNLSLLHSNRVKQCPVLQSNTKMTVIQCQNLMRT